MVQHATLVRLKGAFEALQGANYTSWPRHIGKVARVLDDPDLSGPAAKLADAANLEEWLETVEASQGGMVGTAQMQWPGDPLESAGLAIRLVRYFDEAQDHVLELGELLFGNGKYDDDVSDVVSSILVPSYADIIECLEKEGLIEEPAAEITPKPPITNRVFLVHGRDNALKSDAARFLEKAGLEVVILHERANKGRTLITKFQEESADVAFALVLVTPDDVGGLVAGEHKSRARQNVIFELGFFIGRLGADRVCALMHPDVEKPSDYDGVAYVQLDDGGAWKAEVMRELAAARLPVDFAKAFGGGA